LFYFIKKPLATRIGISKTQKVPKVTVGRIVYKFHGAKTNLQGHGRKSTISLRGVRCSIRES